MIEGLEKRVVIVGGGPVGLYCAYLIKKQNPRVCVTLLEKNKEIGKSSCCAGHISISGYRQLYLSSLLNLDKFLVNKIRGAYIFGPNKAKLKICTERFQTFLIDRENFEKEIFYLAKDVGVDIKLNQKVSFINDEEIVIDDKQANKYLTIKYDFLIGADGPNSIVRESFLDKKDLLDNIITYQVIAQGDFRKDMVSVYFGEFSKDFFGWVIPISRTQAEIGVGTNLSQNPKLAFDLFLQKSALNLKNIEFNCSGVIPVEKLKEKTFVEKNKILIGDAGSLVKATTGGGLIFGLLSAEEAANTIALRFKDFKEIENYNKLLSKHLSNLNLHYKIHKYLISKSPEELDEMLLKLKDSGIEHFLEKHGNIDFITSIIPKLVIHPKFIKLYKEIIDFIKF